MSALTDRIAAEHIDAGMSHCTCGAMSLGESFPGHVAAVTEAAVREQVARDIRAQRERFSCTGLEDAAYDDAAQIARAGAT